MVMMLCSRIIRAASLSLTSISTQKNDGPRLNLGTAGFSVSMYNLLIW